MDHPPKLFKVVSAVLLAEWLVVGIAVLITRYITSAPLWMPVVACIVHALFRLIFVFGAARRFKYNNISVETLPPWLLFFFSASMLPVLLMLLPTWTFTNLNLVFSDLTQMYFFLVFPGIMFVIVVLPIQRRHVWTTPPRDRNQAPNHNFSWLSFRTFTNCFVAPVLEEIIFRGFIFHGLAELTGSPLMCALLSGALFIWAHKIPTIRRFIGFTLLTAILTAVAWTEIGLLGAITLHMAWNIFAAQRRSSTC